MSEKKPPEGIVPSLLVSSVEEGLLKEDIKEE